MKKTARATKPVRKGRARPVGAAAVRPVRRVRRASAGRASSVPAVTPKRRTLAALVAESAAAVDGGALDPLVGAVPAVCPAIEPWELPCGCALRVLAGGSVDQVWCGEHSLAPAEVSGAAGRMWEHANPEAPGILHDVAVGDDASVLTCPCGFTSSSGERFIAHECDELDITDLPRGSWVARAWRWVFGR